MYNNWATPLNKEKNHTKHDSDAATNSCELRVKLRSRMIWLGPRFFKPPKWSSFTELIDTDKKLPVIWALWFRNLRMQWKSYRPPHYTHMQGHQGKHLLWNQHFSLEALKVELAIAVDWSRLLLSPANNWKGIAVPGPSYFTHHIWKQSMNFITIRAK